MDANTGTFTTELQLNYLITDKTKLAFNLYKALEETDSLENRGKDNITAKIRYDQDFTYKIKGHLELWYEQNKYGNFERIDNNTGIEDRDDYRYFIRPALQYLFREWLMAELAYSFENRNSKDDFYDFTTQTLILSLNAAF